QIRRFHSQFGASEAGRTVEDTVLSAAQAFFSESRMAEPGADAPFGLLIALHPQAKAEGSQLTYTLEYAVFGASDEPLLKGAESARANVGDWSKGGPLDRAPFEATQQVMTAVVAGLRPDMTKYPAALSLKSRSLEFAVKKDKPWANGTGFYINASGQVL